MKVTAFNKYTGEKICELELKECGIEHIADVSQLVRLGECRAHMNDVQEGRVFGYHRFDVSCPDYTPERCYTFCPQFDDQEAR